MKQFFSRTMLVRVMLGTVVASLGASAAAQGIYRWEDKAGHVTYSDSPPPADAKSKQEKKLLDNIVEQDRSPAATRAAQRAHPVTLYVNDCGAPCAAARAMLTKRGIPFTELDPQTNATAAKKLKELAGSLKVPTLTVGKNILDGYLESAWTAALNTAGYPVTNAVTKAAITATRAGDKPPATFANATPASKSAAEKK